MPLLYGGIEVRLHVFLFLEVRVAQHNAVVPLGPIETRNELGRRLYGPQRRCGFGDEQITPFVVDRVLVISPTDRLITE